MPIIGHRTYARLFMPLALAFSLMACDDGAETSTGQQPVFDISVSDAYILDNPGSAPTAAAYMTIYNAGDAPIVLTGVSSPDAGTASLHRMEDSDGVMRMRHDEGMDIPAGGSLVLSPGDKHIMLMQVKRSLAPGDLVSMTLEFDSAPPQRLNVPVRALEDMNGS